MKSLVLFVATFKRSIIELKRYAFNTISGVVTITFFFVLIFYGARAMLGDRGTGSTLEAIVVGYFVWMLAIFAYSEVAFELTQEAQAGTLEQLAMSPLGLPKLLVLRFFSNLGVQLVILFGVLFMMMALSGKWLHLDMLTLMPLLLLTLIGIQGIGFMLGGLAIVFKRVQSALQIMQFVFVLWIAAPVERFPWAKYFPLNWGNRLMQDSMIRQSSIFEMAVADLGFLLANSIGWFALGLLVFRYFDKMAREKALLGHY